MRPLADDLRTRYPQLRGLDTALIEARAADFVDAIRARYAITLQGGDVDRDIRRVVLRHYGWWMLHMDHLRSEGVGVSNATAQYGALPWPAEIAAELSLHSDAPPVVASTRSAPVRYVW